VRAHREFESHLFRQHFKKELELKLYLDTEVNRKAKKAKDDFFKGIAKKFESKEAKK
jgi:hypothetical protein